jgi:hypothetical protein
MQIFAKTDHAPGEAIDIFKAGIQDKEWYVAVLLDLVSDDITLINNLTAATQTQLCLPV